MTKSELKTGMIVRYRYGALRVVMRNYAESDLNAYLVGTDGWIELSKYNEDLTLNDIFHTHNNDIVAVYEVPNRSYMNIFCGKYKLDDSFVMDYGHLIWEREDPVVEMTIKEIEEKLGIKNLRIKD